MPRFFECRFLVQIKNKKDFPLPEVQFVLSFNV